MKGRLELRILAAALTLLGFGAACSTARHASSAPLSEQQRDTTRSEMPQVRAMYGVIPVPYRPIERPDTTAVPSLREADAAAPAHAPAGEEAADPTDLNL